MRPYGTSKQLQERRQHALKLLEQGKSVKDVAIKMSVRDRSVRRWRQERKRPKKKSERPPGKPSYLSKNQIQQLERELLKGAYAHGYSEDYWTLDRIGHVIWTLFKVRYVPSGVWRLLDRMGWSCQKIQRLAIQRNDETIVNWNQRVWPRIKKVARVESDLSAGR
jgi:transposase